MDQESNKELNKPINYHDFSLTDEVRNGANALAFANVVHALETMKVQHESVKKRLPSLTQQLVEATSQKQRQELQNEMQNVRAEISSFPDLYAAMCEQFALAHLALLKEQHDTALRLFYEYDTALQPLYEANRAIQKELRDEEKKLEYVGENLNGSSQTRSLVTLAQRPSFNAQVAELQEMRTEYATLAQQKNKEVRARHKDEVLPLEAQRNKAEMAFNCTNIRTKNLYRIDLLDRGAFQRAAYDYSEQQRATVR